jgi:plastocyanin
MENKCPKCGNFLITRTIKKELSNGSIECPVSQMCPKCDWSKDLTGAGEIRSVAVPADDLKKEELPLFRPGKTQPEAPGSNKIIIAVLSVLVFAVIGMSFLQSGPKQSPEIPTRSTLPAPTPTPGVTPVATTLAVAGITPAPEIKEASATGKKVLVKLDYQRGLLPAMQKIKPGDEIVWENIDIETVTLASSDGLFNARKIFYYDNMNYTFKRSGTYGFYLNENKNLNGTIVVGP